MICTSRQSVIVQISAKTQFSLNGWHTPSFVSLQPMSPRPAQPSRGALTEKPRPNAPTTSGRGNGQSGKKKGGLKEKWMGINLANCDNYHLTRENAMYHLVILHGHLWGGRFQMALIGERQFNGGNGRNGRIFQTEKSRYVLNRLNFQRVDKLLIRADSKYSFPKISYF